MNYRNDNLDQLEGLEKIKHVIYHLDLSLLQSLVLELTEIITNGEQNIIHWMVVELTSSSSDKLWKVTLGPLNHSSFNNREDIRVARYLKIFEYLCKTFPQLIIDRTIERINLYNLSSLLPIVTEYYINDEEAESCFICTLSYQCHLVDCPCLCKFKIHIRCLIQLTETNGFKCKTCRSEIDHRIYRDGLIFYPSIGVYPQPMIKGNYTIVTTDKDRLHYAIVYLQIKIVGDILNRISKESLQNYFDHPHYRSLYIIKDKQLSIKDMIHTNQSRKRYPMSFKAIEFKLNHKIRELGVSIS